MVAGLRHDVGRRWRRAVVEEPGTSAANDSPDVAACTCVVFGRVMFVCAADRTARRRQRTYRVSHSASVGNAAGRRARRPARSNVHVVADVRGPHGCRCSSSRASALVPSECARRSDLRPASLRLQLRDERVDPRTAAARSPGSRRDQPVAPGTRKWRSRVVLEHPNVAVG